MFSLFKKSTVPSHAGHGHAHAGGCCGGGHAREDLGEEQAPEPVVSDVAEPKPGLDEPVVAGRHGHE